MKIENTRNGYHVVIEMIVERLCCYVGVVRLRGAEQGRPMHAGYSNSLIGEYQPRM